MKNINFIQYHMAMDECYFTNHRIDDKINPVEKY